MTIYPAIDILGGKCVRLCQGDYEQSTVYGDNPSIMAKQWCEQGGKWLHLVDLDGAKAGQPVNVDAVKSIRQTVDIPLEIGGGIRNEEHIKMVLDLGVNRVILGTKAVESLDFVRKMVDKYQEKIVVGIDAKDGYVAVSGWVESSEFMAVPFAQEIEKCGVKTIIYTDIATDGMLTGSNISAMTQMASGVNIDVVASGGIGCLQDVKNLLPTGVEGVIIGRALYANKISLTEAVNLK